ncbi:hypothetical protein [Helicobacter pylori]|uniref:hypothetical protein n=1 Tax=Helicobacter pylori TaxID=210 RepID=UPI001BB3780C|nr:hypothetical protein [Helicobacter pylori]
MIERATPFQLGFLGQRHKQTKTPLPLAEWLWLALGGLDSLKTIQTLKRHANKRFWLVYRAGNVHADFKEQSLSC